MKKISAGLIALICILGLAGCGKQKTDAPPTDEHPTPEHPTGEHPAGEHPE